jgi:hypothetical protein
MIFVKGALQRSATMAACAEGNQLTGIADVGLALVVLRFQLRHVNKHFLGRGLAGKRGKRGSGLGF